VTQAWTIRSLTAMAGFAVWTLFSIPLLTGRAGIREAWDFPACWHRGIPLLLLLAAARGLFQQGVPWKLALRAVAGHFLGVVPVKQPTTDFGLLPLSLLLPRSPGLCALTLAVWLGQQGRQLVQPGVWFFRKRFTRPDGRYLHGNLSPAARLSGRTGA
jgi:hypothetical protein